MGALAVDGGGQVYASWGGVSYGRVYTIQPGGALNLFWSAADAPGSMAFSPLSPNLFAWMIRGDNSRDIVQVTPAGVASSFVGGFSGQQISFAFDAEGSMWLAWANANQIRKYDASGNLLFSFSTGAYSPGAITISAGSSPVPEIDPAGMASVLTLLAGALGLVERRRSRPAPA